MRTKFLSLLAACAALSLSSVAAEAAGKTLTVYTYESFVSDWGPGPKVKESFEKTCGCKVEWVGVADGVESGLLFHAGLGWYDADLAQRSKRQRLRHVFTLSGGRRDRAGSI